MLAFCSISCGLLLLLPVLYGPASKSLPGEHIGLSELKLLVSTAGAKHTSFLHEVPNHRYCIVTYGVGTLEGEREK